MMAFIARAPAKVTKLKLVKWLFVAAAEYEAAVHVPFYDFLPYQSGPFSFTAYHELQRLSARGFVKQENHALSLEAKRKVTSAVRKLPPAASKVVDDVLSVYGRLGRTAIIARVYEKHPWFASRSRLRPAVIPASAPSAVYTCGYQGVSIDAFLNRLLTKGIKQVVDVRKNAYSMKYGFTGGVFRSLCKNVGIDYTHVPQLGVPSNLRTDLDRPGARAALFAHYRSIIVPTQREALERVARMTEERASALLCFEAQAHECHRSSLAPFIAEQTGLAVVHL